MKRYKCSGFITNCCVPCRWTCPLPGPAGPPRSHRRNRTYRFNRSNRRNGSNRPGRSRRSGRGRRTDRIYRPYRRDRCRRGGGDSRPYRRNRPDRLYRRDRCNGRDRPDRSRRSYRRDRKHRAQSVQFVCQSRCSSGRGRKSGVAFFDDRSGACGSSAGRDRQCLERHISHNPTDRRQHTGCYDQGSGRSGHQS